MEYEMGLGEMREERIELLGERLDDLRVSWSSADLRNLALSSRSGCPMRSCSRDPSWLVTANEDRR